MSSFSPGDLVIVENGNFCRKGPVLSQPSDEVVIVEIIGNKLKCPISMVRLAGMSAERPWEHFNREELEGALATQAAQIARLTTEAQGMAEVLAMQMEAMNDTGARAEIANLNRTIVSLVDDMAANEVANIEHRERLIDLLELYLVRTVGQRNPVAIADPDLRALVSHIRD